MTQATNPNRSLRFRASLGAAILGLLFTLPLLAQPGLDGSGGPGEGHRLGPIAKLLPPPGYLDLDDEQIAATQEILGSLREVAEPLRDEQRENRQALRELLEGDAPDATAVGTLVINGHDLRAQLRAALETADRDFTALLDDEQRIKYESYKELRRAHRRQGRGGRGPGMGGGAGNA